MRALHVEKSMEGIARLSGGGWPRRARLTGLANSISGSVGSGGGGRADMLWLLLGSLRLRTSTVVWGQGAIRGLVCNRACSKHGCTLKCQMMDSLI